MALYPGVPNTKLSIGQIVSYLSNAGFKGVDLITMTAITLAESGGNTASYNPADPYGGSFGIVQINGSHFVNGSTTMQCAFDPQCSANFAYALFKGRGNFTDWGTFTDGSYKKYLSQATSGTTQTATLSSTTSTGSDPVASALQQVFAPVLNLFSGAQGIASWLDPLRVLKMVLGLLCLLVALLMLLAPVAEPVINATAKPAIQMATKAALA
jgi:Lysozyme like domain